MYTSCHIYHVFYFELGRLVDEGNGGWGEQKMRDACMLTLLDYPGVS